MSDDKVSSIQQELEIDCDGNADEWRSQICELFTELSLEPSDHGDFVGAAKHKKIGELKFTNICAGGQIVRRGKNEIKRSATDQLFLILQKRGGCEVFSEVGDAVRMLAGDAILVNPQTPYILNFQGAADQICIQIPSADIRQRISNQDHLIVGRKIDRADSVSKVLAASINDLAESVERSAEEAESSVDLFYDVIVGCLRRICQKFPSRDYAPRLTAFNALVGFVVNNLTAEELSPAAAAAELGMSLRSLNRLCYENGTTFGKLVLNSRLTAAAHALRESRGDARGRITHIAFELGFADLSHFSKAFKAKYGVSPANFLKSRC